MMVAQKLSALDAGSSQYATDFVHELLHGSIDSGTSDVHLQPTADSLVVRWRIDGVLQLVGEFPRGSTADIVTRLKVLAGLLTYQADLPQEGRLKEPLDGIEMRVSTIPTVFGERAVIRLFATSSRLTQLDDLGLPSDLLPGFEKMLTETTGAVLVTGPAGSGKTTTAYAALRHLVDHADGGRSIVSIEDPVEVIVPGVSQSQTNEASGFDLSSGLKSMLRQDPEVIFVGEIRDRETAEVAFQAALTGQLVVSTFHAGSACEAVSRLLEMGIEPYVLRSALLGVVGQRLVRRLCSCAKTSSSSEELLGFDVPSTKIGTGCEACKGTGYSGRVVMAELLPFARSAIGNAVLNREDTLTLEKVAVDSGVRTLWDRALELLKSGETTPKEIRRVMGWRDEEHQ